MVWSKKYWSISSEAYLPSGTSILEGMARFLIGFGHSTSIGSFTFEGGESAACRIVESFVFAFFRGEGDLHKDTIASMASPIAFMSFFGRKARNRAWVLVKGLVCSVTISILCAPRMILVPSSTVSSVFNLRFLFFTRRLRVAAFQRFYCINRPINVLAFLIITTHLDRILRPPR